MSLIERYFAGKTAAISGAGDGIGRALSQRLNAAGCHLWLSDINSETLAETCASLDEARGRVTSQVVDCGQRDALFSWAEAVSADTSSLDALFNNGAYAIPGPVEDVPTEALRTIFQANLIGWHDLTRRVIPVMRGQGHGRIVQCSSVLGLVAMKWRGAYVATKFALEGLSDAMRLELAGTGIEVVIIDPGPIDTPFRQNAIKQFEKWIDWENSMRVEEYRESLLDQLYKGSSKGPQWPAAAVTKRLIRALESPRPKARYYVTTPTYVMGALRRVLPVRALDWVLSRG